MDEVKKDIEDEGCRSWMEIPKVVTVNMMC